MGMITPDRGEVLFEGRDITRLPMYKRARFGIGYLSQEPSIFQRLTVRENLNAILETISISRAERNRRASMLIERFSLEEVANSHPEIVKVPAPRVRMRALGNSSLDFELLAWIGHPQLRGRIRHDLLINIYKAFKQNGIEIPFPQTDIHVRSMPEQD